MLTEAQKAQLARMHEGNRTHGHCVGDTMSPIYAIWSAMKARCSNPRLKGYPDYGRRGIRVCESWLIFENFLADMGEPPEGLTLDRIDNDGNYEPSNCRWASTSIQQSNRRPYTRSDCGELNKSAKLTNLQAAEIRASTEPQRKLAVRFGVSKTTIGFIRRGETYKLVPDVA